MNETPTTLYRATAQGLTLQAAVNAALTVLRGDDGHDREGQTAGFYYAPRESRCVRRVGDALQELALSQFAGGVPRFEEREVALREQSPIYELKLFDGDTEFRWLRDIARLEVGTAALVTESKTAFEALSPQAAKDDAAANGSDAGRADGQWIAIDTKEYSSENIHKSQYLLWGKPLPGGGLAAGWTCLWEARVPPFAAPLGGVSGEQRVALDVVDYIGRDPGEAGQHGNCSVLEERLVRFRRADGS